MDGRVKIDFEGQVRTLDLVHVSLRHASAVQDFTRLALLPWLTQLNARMRAEPSWIDNMAAAHWLMLAQNGEEPPPLDGAYDCDVLGFALAFVVALVEQEKAAAAQELPKAPSPGRPARSSRRTPTPATTEAEETPPLSSPTGS